MKKKYRNTAFLLELMINILVFSLSCAILVGLFGKAYQIANRTREAAFASTEVLRVVEVAKVRGAQGVAGATLQSDGSIALWYDKNWQPTNEERALYHIELRVDEQNTHAGILLQFDAVAKTSDGREVYSLQTASYQPSKEGSAA